MRDSPHAIAASLRSVAHVATYAVRERANTRVYATPFVNLAQDGAVEPSIPRYARPNGKDKLRPVALATSSVHRRREQRWSQSGRSAHARLNYARRNVDV